MASHRTEMQAPPIQNYGGNNFAIGGSGPNSVLETTSQRSIGVKNYNQQSNRQLSNEEKKKVIMGLKEKRKDLMMQLNRLPLLKDTLGVIELERKLQKEIDEVETAIMMFQYRKNVYLTDQNTFQF
ncbi:hypothetical protein FGO68_gene11151 [Halteria grandinella]|uniref:Enkurin domain-containing protein n=1 Tax=Halteria grandinella TaxID=5974 RepID=A0A8J8NUU9_HALGN|nr:hypothetical protein FGO68_gene11151 [Halteria grandinella]